MTRVSSLATSSKPKKVVPKYVADFETTSEPQFLIENKTKVNLFYVENINDESDNEIGCFIQDFIDWCFDGDKKIVYFHNLSFDGMFLIHYCQENDIKYKATMDNHNTIFRISVYKGNKNSVQCTFKCSYKLLSCGVEDLPNQRGLAKGKYDYKKIRNPKSIQDFTPNEILYVKNDVKIVCDAMRELQETFGNKLTIGSCAYSNWKETQSNFDYDFPKLKDRITELVRDTYRGGLVIVNPKIRGKELNFTIDTYDENSLYPSVMLYKNLPYGLPKEPGTKESFDRYKAEGYDLAVYNVHVGKMKIKPGHHPFYALSELGLGMFGKNTITYEEELVNLYIPLTSIDLELLDRYYDMDYEIDYSTCFQFRSRVGTFDEYVNYWKHIKETSPKDSFMRMLAKLMLNTLYGKFGTRRDRISREIDCSDLSFKDTEVYSFAYYYTPMATFITAHARDMLVTGIQGEKEGFLYCDTDSLHIVSELYNDSLDVDPTRFGAWDKEATHVGGKFLGAKRYMKYNADGTVESTCAGVSKDNKYKLTKENFLMGSKIENGKRQRKHVHGGYILVDRDFTFTGGTQNG